MKLILNYGYCTEYILFPEPQAIKLVETGFPVSFSVHCKGEFLPNFWSAQVRLLLFFCYLLGKMAYLLVPIRILPFLSRCALLTYILQVKLEPRQKIWEKFT